MSRGTQEQKPKSCLIFAYGPITHLGASFQKLQLTIQFLTLRPDKSGQFLSYNPPPHLATLEWNFQFLIYNLQIVSLKIQ